MYDGKSSKTEQACRSATLRRPWKEAIDPAHVMCVFAGGWDLLSSWCWDCGGRNSVQVREQHISHSAVDYFLEKVEKVFSF